MDREGSGRSQSQELYPVATPGIGPGLTELESPSAVEKAQSLENSFLPPMLMLSEAAVRLSSNDIVLWGEKATSIFYSHLFFLSE